MFEAIKSKIESHLNTPNLGEKYEDVFSVIEENRRHGGMFLMRTFQLMVIFSVFFVIVAVVSEENLVNLGIFGDFFGLFSTVLAVFGLVIVMREVRINSELMIMNSYLRIIDAEKDREHSQQMVADADALRGMR